MKVYGVTNIVGGWLEYGPPSLHTVYSYGWPSMVADIVLANKDHKVKEVPQSMPSPPKSDSTSPSET